MSRTVRAAAATARAIKAPRPLDVVAASNHKKLFEPGSRARPGDEIQFSGSIAGGRSPQKRRVRELWAAVAVVAAPRSGSSMLSPRTGSSIATATAIAAQSTPIACRFSQADARAFSIVRAWRINSRRSSAKHLRSVATRSTMVLAGTMTFATRLRFPWCSRVSRRRWFSIRQN